MVWGDLTLGTINGLVAEIPQRINKVIRNEARSIQVLQ
jgi:hypothetical protein